MDGGVRRFARLVEHQAGGRQRERAGAAQFEYAQRLASLDELLHPRGASGQIRDGEDVTIDVGESGEGLRLLTD